MKPYAIVGPCSLATSALLFTGTQAQALPESPSLDVGEEYHLVFMREEEKLARDVYLTFAQMYPNPRIFQRIAERGEQTHTDRVRWLLETFQVQDPEPSTNDLPANVGKFEGQVMGSAFRSKYQTLVARGSIDLLSALYVGAWIEEMDMLHIKTCPDLIVSFNPGMNAKSCGLMHTNQPSIRQVYTHLLDGSQNHLRAFVWQIERQIGDGNYRAQILPQAEVNDILGR